MVATEDCAIDEDFLFMGREPVQMQGQEKVPSEMLLRKRAKNNSLVEEPRRIIGIIQKGNNRLWQKRQRLRVKRK